MGVGSGGWKGGLAVNVEMPGARRPPKPPLPELKPTPGKREEMLQDKAWPLCGSSLGSLFSVLQHPGPTATSGNGEWSWPLW